MFGFTFGSEFAGGELKLLEQGTLKRRMNTHGSIPITAIYEHCGSVEDNHTSIQKMGVSYPYYLNSVQERSKAFYSLSSDGLLLCWIANSMKKHNEAVLPFEGPSRPTLSLGGASRLVPHVCVFVDMETKRLFCCDLGVDGGIVDPAIEVSFAYPPRK